MSPLIALVLLLTALLLLAAMFFVGRARAKHGIHAPATSGHPDFDRAFRAQMNTVEAAVMFVPVLLVAGSFADPRWAAGLGGLWLLGRVLYLEGYLRDAKARGTGFMVASLTWLALLALGGWGVAVALLAG